MKLVKNVDGSKAYSYRNRTDIIVLNMQIHDFGEAIGGGYVALGGIRDFTHEIRHVASGNFGGADDFQEQFVVNEYENRITESLNNLPKYDVGWKLFGQRGNYFSVQQIVEQNSRVYR